MAQTRPNIFDIDLTTHDLQGLNSADAVAAFFARLGYDTEARTPQTAGNLGITADSTSRPIKKVELVANQEGLLQVYLFELQSITVAHTRALARAFRNRAGNYLLVLTSDYERLDFVFLERELPTAPSAEQLLAEKQSAIRPRGLTVERRNPTAIQLRVLRRLTWTESDPFYQYEKLKAAYDLANWSEDYFNNRALFSDYYLKERLPDFSDWKEDPKPTYLKLREIYQGYYPLRGKRKKGFISRASETSSKSLRIRCQRWKKQPERDHRAPLQTLPQGEQKEPIGILSGLSLESLTGREGRPTRQGHSGRKSRRGCCFSLGKG